VIPTAAVEMASVENALDIFRARTAGEPGFPARESHFAEIFRGNSLVEKLCTLCGARNFLR